MDHLRRFLLTGLLVLAAGCSDGSLPTGLSLRQAVAGGKPAAAGLRFFKKPEILSFTFDGERREAVLTSVEPWRWTGRVPPGAELHAGIQILPEAWQVIRGLRAWVVARCGEESEVVDVVRTTERERPRWLDFTAGLSRWEGREVTLEFHADLEGLPPEHRHTHLVAWGPVRLSSPAERERPNVLFILVDTLRHDHLTPYGYKRETSPEIARVLAKQGAVVEEAYSQAPWTLPSVVSYMTSRYPGELLGDDPAAYGIPGGVPTLAQSMKALGYETGGFVANKVMHAGNGFAQGFDTFYSPPEETEGVDQPDAAELSSRVLPWLEAHRNDPFFLYVHYLDPHDPYDNPDLVNGRSPFYPNYRGRISGNHVQGVYVGKIPLDNQVDDTEHLKALYDSEIRYADRFIGRLIDSIPPHVLENTLIVLTADHGEEFREHGGWKHGFTLYEDQIHVPLLVRWDGRIPAGSRLKGTVRLLDLLPTLIRAAGGKANPSWEGIDLLPALTGREPLPRLPAFAQHMMIGPLRAAAVLDRRKLILFNSRTPFAPADPLQDHLWRLDAQRLKRVELYDLSRDAGEKANRAAAAPGEVARLQPVIHRQLDRQLPGLRVVASGLPAGSRLRGSITLERAPARLLSYFLAEDDRVELTGGRVDFDLGGEALEKGFLVEGGGKVRSTEAALDGKALPVLTGAQGPTAAGPALRVWYAEDRRAPARTAPDPETEKRLRALGYAQ
jgi:arylsulfatase